MAKPFLYILSAIRGLTLRNKDIVKIGTSWHPDSRKWCMQTARPEQLIYKHLFELDSLQFKTPSELYNVDAYEWKEFLAQKNLAHIHIQEGGGTEFYEAREDCITLIREFLVSKGYRIVCEYTEDPYPVRPLTEKDTDVYLKECVEQTRVRIATKTTLSLWDRFRNVFVSTPRKHQTELWDIFQKVCDTWETGLYSGIVQWPTGTGKTIATLMMTVLIADRYKKKGCVYRGLFISPRTDILQTITKDFTKLSQFGITLLDGSDGKLSSLNIPNDKNILIVGTHMALTNKKTLEQLPFISHVHYDEVHRITGDSLFESLRTVMPHWQTQFLTGTSATPETADGNQRAKLHELFGDPLRFIDTLSIERAIQEGYLARPRFCIEIVKTDSKEDIRTSFLRAMCRTIQEKKTRGMRGNKIICYLPTVELVKEYARYAKEMYPTFTFYTATDDNRTDYQFVKAPIDDRYHILFACGRYKEGSDVGGMELVCILMGHEISAHTVLQTHGRALRKEYAEKEGWCLLVRPSSPNSPSDDTTTKESVLDRIVLDILSLSGKTEKLTRADICARVELYFGNLTLESHQCTLEETIDRVQAAYERDEYSRHPPKERYKQLQAKNKELGVRSKSEYFSRRGEYIHFVEEPRKYFDGHWTCWYDYLGVDCTGYPQTLDIWLDICKTLGFHSWSHYQTTHDITLPDDPGQLYETYKNWEAHFQSSETYW